MGFKKNSLYMLLMRVATLVSGAATSIIVSQVLGAEGKGVVHLVFLFPVMISSLGGLGARASAVYFAARGYNQKDLARTFLYLALALSAVYLAAGIALKGPLTDVVLKGLEVRWVWLALALVPVFLLSTYGDGLLQGMQRFGVSTAIQISALLLKVALVVLVLVVLDGGLGSAVVVYTAASVLALILTVGSVWILAKDSPVRASPREVLGYGLQSYWGTVALRATVSLNVFIINPLLGTVAVGLYSVAEVLAMLVQDAPVAISEVLFPRVASATPREAATTVSFLSRQVVIMGVIPAVVLAFIAPWFIPLVFSEEFRGAHTVLWALLPGFILLGQGIMIHQYLAGTGHPSLNSLASLAGLIVNVVALFVLIPIWGIVGAGIAASVAHAVRTVLVAVFFHRLAGVPVIRILLPHPSDAASYARAWQQIRAAMTARIGRPGTA